MRRKGGQAALLLKEYQASHLEIVSYGGNDAPLERLELEFSGPSSQMPNGTNGKRAFQPKGMSFPVIVHSKVTTRRLKLMKELYAQHLYKAGASGFAFEEEPLVMFIALADPIRKDRLQDSINSPKSVADWLQAMGIVVDDSCIEGHPIRKSDYPERFSNVSTTTILIERRERCQPSLSRLVGEMFDAPS